MSNVAEAEAKEDTEEEEEEERASASVHYSAVFLRHGIWQPSAVLQPPSLPPSSVVGALVGSSNRNQLPRTKRTQTNAAPEKDAFDGAII